MSGPIFQVKDICKSFPGVQALKNVHLEIFPGEIHALIGENGSGKSTLMKIITGIYKQEKGEIFIDGNKVDAWNTLISQKHGVSAIYQELSLFPDLTVAENIFLGHDQFTKSGVVKWRLINKDTKKLLNYLRVEIIEPKTRVENLSVAQRQLVEIAKALAASEVKILLMDEPTSALSIDEVDNLFSVISKLKKDGVGIIFISHKLEEVIQIADKVTVLRDGEYVGSRKINEINKDDLIKMMIGRDISGITKRKSHRLRERILEVKNLTKIGIFKNISFDLYKGEILGIYGLVGSKRTEVAQAVFGITSVDMGTITLNNESVKIADSSHALKLGLGLLPEDRATEGLILDMNLFENTTLPILNKLFPSMIINKSKEIIATEKICSDLDVKYGDLYDKVDSLSGGNKQKIVLAKWVLTKAKILIFDEPTKGIDVGAKEVIHNLMDEISMKGVGIIMISSEIPEILKMSDRVIIMSKGLITGIFDVSEVTQDKIIRYASMVSDKNNEMISISNDEVN